MIKMLVRGQQLDLFKEEVFAVSKAISKLGEFDLRHGDVSISYKIPTTNKNIATFGYLSNLNNYNLDAFRRYEGQLIEDESIVSSGYFQVLKIDPNKSIEIRFYGGNSDWFDLIRNRDINKSYLNQTSGTNQKSYSLASLNHKFDAATIQSSWSNEDGYFYFPVDDGKNSEKEDNILNITDFQCGVFQHTIVSEIFNSIGVKLQGSLFNDPLYYNTLINQPSDLTVYNTQNNYKRFTTVVGTPIGQTLTPINYPNSDFDTQWNGHTFTAESDIDTLKFQIRIQTSSGTFYDYGLTELTVKYTINGVAQPDRVGVPLGAYTQQVAGIQYISYYDVNEETDPFLNVKIGDTFEFYLTNIDNLSPPGSDPVRMVESFYFENVGTVQSYIDYTIEGAITKFSVTDIVPEINQADFIKDMMFRHGVISQYNSITRTLTLNKFEDIQRNKHVAVDYSNKIDLLNPPVYDFTKVLSGFKKTSKINYSPDDNDTYLRLFRANYKRGLGDATIEIDNDNLSGEGVIYESIFSATIQGWTWAYDVSKNDADFYLPIVQVFKSNGITEENPSTNKYDLQDLNPRIFVKAGNIPVESINVGGYDEITLTDYGVSSTVGYAYFAKQLLNEPNLTDKSLNENLDTMSFDNINQGSTNYMGTTLLQKNYNLYFNILRSPIHLSINLDLKPLDMQQVDFMKPVWLNFSLDSGYYYLDNISQYKGDGSTTTVELIKI
jgi:hypothetical protein